MGELESVGVAGEPPVPEESVEAPRFQQLVAESAEEDSIQGLPVSVNPRIRVGNTSFEGREIVPT